MGRYSAVNTDVGTINAAGGATQAVGGGWKATKETARLENIEILIMTRDLKKRMAN